MGKLKASIEGAAAGQPTSEQGTAVVPAVVVFGRDEAGKGHASWFAEADAALAERAAGMMQFKFLRLVTDKHRAAASGLPAGRVFASGKAFSPFVKEAACAALEAFGEAFVPAAPTEPEPVTMPTVTGTPQPWEEIGTGSLVLATICEGEGWFESVVAEARGDDLFVLRWHGYDDHPPFLRRRDGLALLPARSEPGSGRRVAGGASAMEKLLRVRDDVSVVKHLIVGIFMAAQAPTLPEGERRALSALANAARERLEVAESSLEQLISDQRQR